VANTRNPRPLRQAGDAILSQLRLEASLGGANSGPQKPALRLVDAALAALSEAGDREARAAIQAPAALGLEGGENGGMLLRPKATVAAEYAGEVEAVDRALRPPTRLEELGARVRFVDAIRYGTTAAANVGLVASWLADGGASELPLTKISTGASNTPGRQLGVRVVCSRRWLIQALDAEELLRDEMAAATAQAVEEAALGGSGNDGEPSGLLYSAGIDSAAVSATPTVAELAALAEPIVKRSGSENVALFVSADQYAELSGGATPVIEPVEGQPGMYHCRGLRTLFSGGLPAGTAIAGDFRHFLVLYQGPSELITDPFTYAESGQIQLTLHHFVDAVATNATAFRRGLSS